MSDFLGAIATQLDRGQDALATKAVNRPLTYAVKDFEMSLKVVVDMDDQGRVLFRPSRPNEEGRTSTVRVGFTTITRPMIAENTVAVTESRSPSLTELGLDTGERQRLAEMGVHNAGQLRRLRSVTGDAAVSRLTNIPMQRLRHALARGRPILEKVEPVPSGPEGGRRPFEGVRPHRPEEEPERPAERPPFGRIPRRERPPEREVLRPIPPRERPPEREDFRPRPRHEQPPVLVAPAPERPRPIEVPRRLVETPVVRVAPGIERLRLTGHHLVDPAGMPEVRLNERVLEIADADADYVDVRLPSDARSGSLEITLPDGQTLSGALSIAGQAAPEGGVYTGAGSERQDPWLPREGGGS